MTRKIRAQGWIPAIFYGRKQEPKLLEVNGREFAALTRGKKLSHLIDLGLGSDDSIAVIKEVQRHVLKDDVVFHIDFQHVAMNEKITVEVPLEVSGIPIGVKEMGGVLGHPVKAIKVECMPADIPEKITIDVSALEIGDSIHIRDIVVGANITIKDSADEVVAVVTHPTREIVEEPKVAAEGEVPVEGEAPVAEGAEQAAPGAAAAPEQPPKPEKKKE